VADTKADAFYWDRLIAWKERLDRAYAALS
jgi:hypothetical protein